MTWGHMGNELRLTHLDRGKKDVTLDTHFKHHDQRKDMNSYGNLFSEADK